MEEDKTMKTKFFLIIAIILLKTSLCLGQQQKYDIKRTLTVEEIRYIKLFKMNQDSGNCIDQKAGSVITAHKMSPCFKFVRNFTCLESKRIIRLLRSKNTYGFLKYDCFSTDYAIVIYGYNDSVIGYVNFSFICSNLYSVTEIEEQNSLSSKNKNLVGFSNNGKTQILKLLRLSNIKFQ